MIGLGATIFTVAAALVISLHLTLILGAPIGFMTMGGRHSGVLPTSARLASFLQAILVVCFVLIVQQAAGRVSVLPDLPWLIWMVVGVSALSLLANSITPSKRERLFGVPASLGMLAGSTLVALGD